MIAFSSRTNATRPFSDCELPVGLDEDSSRREGLWRLARYGLAVTCGAAVAILLSSVLAEHGRREGGDVIATNLFAAVSGAAAVALALTASTLRRRAHIASRRIAALQARLDGDLTLERSFVLRGGQLAPSSPSAEAYLRVAPNVEENAPNRRRLRAHLGKQTFLTLAP